MIAKILHITFAILVFLSSAGITVRKHYCQNKLESISFLPTNSCCKSKKHSACKKSADNCKKGCCSSEYVYFQSDQDLQIQHIEELSFNFPIQNIAVHFTDLTTSFTEFLTAKKYLIYKPPIVLADISVLYQIFRL